VDDVVVFVDVVMMNQEKQTSRLPTRTLCIPAIHRKSPHAMRRSHHPKFDFSFFFPPSTLMMSILAQLPLS
jgi:hypothetical protein